MPFLIVPVLITIFGYLIMKKMVLDLVDEVLDAGDAADPEWARAGASLASNIINVSYTQFSNRCGSPCR